MSDLLSGCMEGSQLDPKTFQEVFCAHCRNRECSLARWGLDKFAQRVGTQAERLLSPTQVDPKHFTKVKLGEFVDMFKVAAEMEASVRRGEWAMPEIAMWNTPEAETPAATPVPPKATPEKPPVVEPETEEPDVEEPDVEEPALPAPPPRAVHLATPPGPLPPTGNTPLPAGGLIIGGGEAPVSPPKPRAPAYDPWSLETPVVKPGARIQVGRKA